MKILIYSPAFYPSVGGLEAVVAMIADGLTALGCCVRVVTTTSVSDNDSSFRYEIIRFPSPSALFSLVRWCDVFFHHNVSLKGFWPLILVRRPWVVAHHGWYERSDGSIGWQDRLKLFAARFAVNVAVSGPVADRLSLPCSVIHNPYRDDLFKVENEKPRDRELVFLGRLVSDKGCDLLLEALAFLAARGEYPRLTVIGSGPDEQRLKEQARHLAVDDHVFFAGVRQGHELVQMLNEHRIMVIPSRWNEPFGIVALEGIACGCAVIASAGGGLPEAVGPCGVMFPNGDAGALAGHISGLLKDPDRIVRFREAAPGHLADNRRASVMKRYLQVLEQVAGARSTLCKNAG